jgi:hypothetical protein
MQARTRVRPRIGETHWGRDPRRLVESGDREPRHASVGHSRSLSGIPNTTATSAESDQASVPGGSTYRSGARASELIAPVNLEPCSPRVEAPGTATSGFP